MAVLWKMERQGHWVWMVLHRGHGVVSDVHTLFCHDLSLLASGLPHFFCSFVVFICFVCLFECTLIRLGSEHLCLCFSNRSTLQQASAQPCYLLPTLSPGRPSGPHPGRFPPRTRQPAPADGPGRPPAPPCTPPGPHCPARAPSVSGCAGGFIPTSGFTPAVPHPAAAPGSAAPQDSAALQVVMHPHQ